MTAAGLSILLIWDDVLEELAASGARATIAALSLTDRSFRLPSQRALFRRLRFTSGENSGATLKIMQNLCCDSDSRLRGYVHQVELCHWLPYRQYGQINDESEESKQLRQIFLEMLSLLEHLPHLLSLKVSGVPLENNTLEQLSAKLPSLTNVEVGYCDWNNDNSPENTTVTTIHGIKNVRIAYRVPSPDCFSPGGRIQIPALLHTARALILPGQIHRLSVLANHGLEDLLTQLASTKADFPRLASLALICPAASSASDIVLFLRRCPALEELSIDRQDYANRRIEWTWPDQQDERDSISSNSRALETVTLVSDGFLPALKAFTGSLDETITILKLPGVHIERLEVHRTIERLTREQERAGDVAYEPLPYEAIDELMDALEMASPGSRIHVRELKCIDQRWCESARWCTTEQDAAREVGKPPQRVHDIFPNLRTFAYRGAIFR